jgi:hypothetical protein
MDEKTISLISLLIARLDRISADSVWAHRASGVKGSLHKLLEKFKKEEDAKQATEVERIINMGFFILEQAAKEKA